MSSTKSESNNSAFPLGRKVLFVARNLAFGGNCGNDEYVIAVLKAMGDAGFVIDYLWLGYPGMHLHWHRLPSRMVAARRHDMPFVWRIGDWIAPREAALWLWILLRRCWNFSQRFGLLRRSKALQKAGAWLKEQLIRREDLTRSVRDEDVTAFRRAMEEARPDLIIANYFFLAPLFDAVKEPEVAKAVLTHDASHGKTPRQVEVDCLEKADVLLAIQEDDVVELKRDVPSCDVIPFPMPLEPLKLERRPRRGRLLYVGSNHLLNVEGLDWFLRQVWPRLLASLAEVELHVCGNIDKAFTDTFPQVEFLGRVYDLAREYAEAAIVIVPLLGGTGLKIKLVEALQHGCPVVSTSPGLQGLGFAENRCIVRADTPEELAMTLHQLLTDEPERQRLEAQAQVVIEEHFSPQACVRPLREWMDRRKPVSAHV